MVYLYVLATGTLPSPWSRVTSYDGRYLRCASSGFGTTGGAKSHRHPTVACNSGTASGGDSYGEYSGSMAAHSHPVPVTYTGYSNNDPSFYTLSLWRMDATTWESSYRYFPAGVVVASTTTVSATGFSRFTSADDRLIKLADPGSSGGRSTHADHTLSGSLTAVAPGRSAGYPYYHYCGLLKSHSHTYSVSSLTQNTILPARVTTRLYVTTAQTDHAPANIVCFFDGAPSANWEQVSGWAGSFLRSGNSDPATAGSDIHGHDDVITTSSSWSEQNFTWGGGGAVPVSHSHTLAIPIDSSDHKPLYVDLVPYRLKIDLVLKVEQSKTVSVSTVLKRISTQTFSASARLKKAGSETIEVGGIVKLVTETEFGVDAVAKNADVEKTFNTSLLILARQKPAFVASALLRQEGSSLGLSARLVRRPIPGLILDSMVKSYVRQFDQIQMLVQGMAWANRIESAVGTELDQKWGHVFDLPRERGESDQDYRERLVVFTPLLVGSGSPGPLKTALDYVTGYPGSSEIETYWPAEAVVRFTNPEAIRKARDNLELVEYILSLGFASGVSHELILPIADFGLSCRLWGSTAVPLDIGTRLLAEDVETEFEVDASIMTRAGEAFDLVTILKLVRAEPQNVSVLVEAWREAVVPVSARVRSEEAEPVPVSTLLLRRASRETLVAARLAKLGRAAGVPVSSRFKRPRIWPYYARTGLKKVGIADGSIGLSAVVAA